MKLKKYLLGLLTGLSLTSLSDSSSEYRGVFTPDAEYVLSGQLAADLPELPKVPFSLEAAGFRDDLLSRVPQAGIHPRVVLSPADIEEIKAHLAKGDKAETIFKVCMRELKNKAAAAKPMRDNYGNAPWGGVGVIAAKALLAQITDDAKLGKEAAEWTVKHAEYLEPMIDLMNSHPEAANFKDNFYYFSRCGMRVGGVDYHKAFREGGYDNVQKLKKEGVEFFVQDNQWAYTSLGTEYDYAYNFMNGKQRDYVRSVISKATYGKYTTGMEIPGHFFINNHMSMGAEFYTLLMAIEGEKGFDKRAAKEMVPRLMDKMTYDISPAGILYENVKGFIPIYPIYAAGRRGERNHLKHNHLRSLFLAKAYASENLQNRYFARGRNRQTVKPPKYGEGLKDPRFWILGADSGPGGHASFVWGWVLKRLFPEDKVIDYTYKVSLQTCNFDLYDGSDDEINYGGKIHYNSRNLIDLMLLCATDGDRDKSGKVIDYQQVGPPNELKEMDLAWKDMHRGLARIRSGWDKDDMVVNYECRSDVYYGGHETPEQGDFRLSSHGVLWSPYTGAYMDSYFRNMVLVDGYAGVYQPTPGKLLEVNNNEQAATIVSDATDAYNWKKMEKNFYMWHGMLGQNDAFTDWQRNGGMRMNRDWELPFQKHMRDFYDGFAHLDWGPWHGETRGPEMYERWNNLEYVFRTMHMARGKRPYLLIMDDLKKQDDQKHQFDWNFALPGDVRLYKANSAAKNRHLVKGTEGVIGTDLIFTMGDSQHKRGTVPIFGGSIPNITIEPKQGDPMLLVRVLWRNTNFAYPLPSFEQTWKLNRVKIPAYGVDPQYKVLMYPYRHGEELPFTRWSDDRSQLEIAFNGQEDLYTFDKTDRQRTVFSMHRNGELIMTSHARPAKPVLASSFGFTADRNLSDDEQSDRKLIFNDQAEVKFTGIKSGTEIRYTTDGTKPSKKSKLYSTSIKIDKSCTLKAVTIHHGWIFDDNISEVFELKCEERKMAKANKKVGDLQAGLACEVFSIHHTIFEQNGFFTGYKNMLPELNNSSRLAHVGSADFSIPAIKSKTAKSEMEKGYYRFSGYYHAEESGLHAFKVFSCGPVVLKVANQELIKVIKPYGLSQKNRFGEAVLEKGLHKIELIVCDPVFWKAEQEMDLRVAVLGPADKTYLALTAENLKRPANLKLEELNKIKDSKSLKPIKLANLKPGLIQEKYDWSHKVNNNSVSFIERWGEYKIPNDGLKKDFFAGIAKAKAFDRQPIWTSESNESLNCLVRAYGYLFISEAGEYQFKTDAHGANKLLIAGELAACSNIAGLKAFDTLELQAGLYPIEFLSAQGKGTMMMKTAHDDDFKSMLAGQLLHQPNFQKIETSSEPYLSLDFDKTDGKSLELPKERQFSLILEGATPVKGIKGNGLMFSGKEAKLELGNVKLANDALSFSFWLKRGKHGDSYPVQGLPGKFYVRLRSREAIWTAYYRSPDMLAVNGGKAMIDKDWIHMTIVYDERVKVYVNGELQGSKIVDPSGLYPHSGVHASSIRFMQGEEGGVIDELKIYNRSLSNEEVKVLSSRK